MSFKKKAAAGLVAVGALGGAGAVAYQEYNEIFLEDTALPGEPSPDSNMYSGSYGLACFEEDGIDCENSPDSYFLKVERTANVLPVSLDYVSPHVKDIIVAVEDPDFWDNQDGYVDPARLANCAFIEKRGCSTIDVQLARQWFRGDIPEGFRHEWTQKIPFLNQYIPQIENRKPFEIKIARALNEAFTKEEILEMYLNVVYVGNGAYGVEMFAQTVFNKSSSELDKVESAEFVTRLRSPSLMDGDADPETNREDLKRMYKRRDYIMTDRLIETGNIATVEEAEALIKGRHPERPYNKVSSEVVIDWSVANGIGARHYAQQLNQDIMNRTQSDAYLEGLSLLDLYGNARIATTLNREIHSSVINAVPEFPLDGDGERPETAVVVMKQDGGVASLYGGAFSQEQQTNLAIEPTQSGSFGIKPWSFADSLNKGVATLDTRYPEYAEPYVWEGGNADGSDWKPEGGAKCKVLDAESMCTIEQAIVDSSNRVLFQMQEDRGEAGLKSVDDLMNGFGVYSDNEPEPSMLVGFRESSLAQHVTGLTGMLANSGTPVERHYVDEIWQVSVDSKNQIYCFKCNAEGKTQLLKVETTDAMLQAMRGVVLRGTASNALSDFENITDAAFKTGTQEGNFVVGGNGVFCRAEQEDLTVGVIIRYIDEDKALPQDFYGGSYPAEIWGNIARPLVRQSCSIN